MEIFESSSSNFLFWLLILIIWQMVWKGLALWKAGNNKKATWFIVLFIVNTLGILDIIYLFAVKHAKDHKETISKPEVKE